MYSRKHEVLTPIRLLRMLFPKLAGSWGSILQTVCSAEKRNKEEQSSGEVGNLAGRYNPREGVPVLYLILSLSQSQGLLFIQRSNVWHFLLGGNLIHCFSELLCHQLRRHHTFTCQQPTVQLLDFSQLHHRMFQDLNLHFWMLNRNLLKARITAAADQDWRHRYWLSTFPNKSFILSYL